MVLNNLYVYLRGPSLIFHNIATSACLPCVKCRLFPSWALWEVPSVTVTHCLGSTLCDVPSVLVAYHVGHRRVPCGTSSRTLWDIVTYHVGRVFCPDGYLVGSAVCTRRVPCGKRHHYSSRTLWEVASVLVAYLVGSGIITRRVPCEKWHQYSSRTLWEVASLLVE